MRMLLILVVLKSCIDIFNFLVSPILKSMLQWKRERLNFQLQSYSKLVVSTPTYCSSKTLKKKKKKKSVSLSLLVIKIYFLLFFLYFSSFLLLLFIFVSNSLFFSLKLSQRRRGHWRRSGGLRSAKAWRGYLDFSVWQRGCVGGGIRGSVWPRWQWMWVVMSMGMGLWVLVVVGC